LPGRRSEYDRVYNLGDIVGYGANPNEVTDRSRALGSVFVRGNHDKACSGLSDLSDFNPIAGMAALWTREKLTQDHLEFLRELPHGPISPIENLQLVHGSPRDEDEYILMASDAYAILQNAVVPLTFLGTRMSSAAFCWKIPGRANRLPRITNLPRANRPPGWK